MWCVPATATETEEYTLFHGYWTSDYDQRLIYAIRRAICGNGQVEGAEQCDDGNTVDGDGCSADCKSK